uniref:Very-long-chain (3R)-3-hydroxyacyl-CoA dehydratase n=1 Tax=Setaria digitata TaxID=48799 RepID=A0A915PS02_9BILA
MINGGGYAYFEERMKRTRGENFPGYQYSVLRSGLNRTLRRKAEGVSSFRCNFNLILYSGVSSESITMARRPFVYWAQNETLLFLTIDLKDSSDATYTIVDNVFKFHATGVGAHGRCEYNFDLPLFAEVEMEKIDFDRFQDPDGSETEEDYEMINMNSRTPEAEMDALTQRILRECRSKPKTETEFISEEYYESFWEDNISIVKIATFLQLLDVVHALVGFTKGSCQVGLVQVCGRLAIIYLIDGYPDIQNALTTFILIIAYFSIEIFRYSYYLTRNLKVEIALLTWLRYNIWLLLYPVGLLLEGMHMDNYTYKLHFHLVQIVYWIQRWVFTCSLTVTSGRILSDGAMCVRNFCAQCVCNSHYLSQLAAFFIDPRAK